MFDNTVQIARRIFFHLVKLLDSKPQRVVVSQKKSTMADLSRDPESLAAEAGLPLEVYTLARLGASEHASGTMEELTAICEAARNEAKRQGISIARLLTRGSQHDGFYGSQLGHWGSTAKDPTRRSIEAAWNAWNGSNIARGATTFYDPRDQDLLHVDNPAIYRPSSEIDARRRAAGLEWIGETTGIDESRLYLYRPKGALGEPGSSSAIMLALAGASLLLIGSVYA